eukprot:1329303-Pyramimonas_sp.AAC.1
MRGAVHARLGKRRRAGRQVRRPLDAVSRPRNLARRSSFGSELLAACGAAGGLQARLLKLADMVHGPASADEIRRLG